MVEIEIRQEIASITSELKSMSGNEPGYGALWDRRADLLRQLRMLEDRS